MHTRTGEMAGEIWRKLNAKGPLTLSKLTEEMEGDARALFMGLGWLLREDKIEIVEKGKGWNVSLKK